VRPNYELAITVMKLCRSPRWIVVFILTLRMVGDGIAGDANQPAPVLAPPVVTTNGQKRVSWTPYPAAQEFKIFSASDILAPFTLDTSGSNSGYDWTGSLSNSISFHRLEVTPLSSNALLSATVLNRLTYGP